MKREEKNQQTRSRSMDSALAEFSGRGYGASLAYQSLLEKWKMVGYECRFYSNTHSQPLKLMKLFYPNKVVFRNKLKYSEII